MDVLKVLFTESEWAKIKNLEEENAFEYGFGNPAIFNTMLDDNPVLVKYNVARFMLENNLFYDYNHVIPYSSEVSTVPIIKLTTLYEMAHIKSRTSLQNIPQITLSMNEMGKSLIANSNIKAGTTIFADYPLFHAPNSDKPVPPNNYCGNCTKYFAMQDYFSRRNISKKWSKFYKQSMACDCQQESYCGVECKMVSWTSYHSNVCTKNPNHTNRPDLESAKIKYRELCDFASTCFFQSDWPSNINPLLFIKILCKGIKDLSLLMNEKLHNPLSDLSLHLNSKVKSDGRANDTKEITILGLYIIRNLLGSFTCPGDKEEISTYMRCLGKAKQSINQLANPDNIEAFNISIKEFAIICVIIMKNTQEFDSLSTGDDMNQFFENLSDTRFTSSKTNRVSVERKLSKDFYRNVPEFCGVFVIQSCINHSCDRNALISDFATQDLKKFDHEKEITSIGLHVVAKRAIAKGEHITTSYIGSLDGQISFKIRRRVIWETHKFTCMCTLCKREDNVKKCENCGFIPFNLNDTMSMMNIIGDKNSTQCKKLMACGNCGKVFYCSRKCQTEHWKKRHKHFCVSTK